MSSFETVNESVLTCPYCEEKQFLEGELLEIEECSSCNKKFRASVDYVFSSVGDCELNSEVHDFENTYKELWECRKCAKYELRRTNAQ